MALKFANTAKIKKYKVSMEKFLAALLKVRGIEPLFLSDRTRLSDFDMSDKNLREMSKILGVKVTRGPLIHLLTDLSKAR